jgi:hypothetical protein
MTSTSGYVLCQRCTLADENVVILHSCTVYIVQCVEEFVRTVQHQTTKFVYGQSVVPVFVR